ncbi:alpha-(1,3)-fucosyltransferase 7-like [Dermacentor silvarum]|uniref:alpha-(1,3)-fucosyltransferase 7-like n=1 Tax=Dermacentor silvarum TaxID=543639 RepID=UPI002101C23D|nr:alpha-(1,3)-fucosyltransferase 7-like [Dermacentor silvarum]
MSPPSSLESEEWHSFTLSDDPDDSDEGDMEPLNPKGAQPKATPVPPGFPRYSPAGEGQRINVRSSAVGFVDMSLLWHAVTVGFRNMVCFVVVAELYMVFLATALSTTELTSSWRPWYDRDGGVSPRILIWTGPPSEISDEASGLAAAHDSSAQHGNWTACNFTAHGNVNAYDVPKPCEVTYDRRLLMESDAIVFHADRVNVSDLPRERAAGQLWVFWARTHPVMPPFVREVGLLGAVSRYLRGKTLPSSLPIQLARVFNWTMSHRKDSVVHVAHKTFGPRFLSTGDSPTSSISSSDRSTMASRRDAAWIASDCELERFKEEHERLRSSHNDRHYRNTLTRPIYLHVMPNCGAGQCESPAECVAQVAKKFKFIVVSQSPACFQSVSDLVYEAFKHDLVPIVLAAPYTTFNFPPKSVLNAAALRAHGRLYSHLTDLLDHPAEYEGYFAWKRNFTVSALEDELCPLCAALQEKTLRATPTWLDIRKWWERHVTCSGAHSIGTSFYKFTIA